MLSTLLAHSVATVLLGAAANPVPDVFVDVNAVACGTGTGMAGDPVCSIGAAVAIAAPGDTIRIAPGTYVENVNIGIDLDLVGTGGASVTTVDGGAAGSVITVGTAVTVMIDGLTLTNGSSGTDGGGVTSEGNLLITNSTISGNTAMLRGGGVSSYYGTLMITNSTISNNTATYLMGGGVSSLYGNMTLSSCTIDGNTSNDYGGGVYADSGMLRVYDCTISNNETLSGYGGGLETMADLVMTGTTVSGNTAYGAGGGLEIYGAGFDIRNCTISGNTGDYGGGMYVLSDTTNTRLLENVTITGNTARYEGGGFYNASAMTTTVHNTLVAGNTDAYTMSPYADTYGDFNSLGFNVIGAGGNGFTNGVNNDQVGTPALPLDALLGPLQDNGGPTLTHMLMPGSPAIDAGDVLNFEPFDQRGAVRPQGAGPDVGAYEVETISDLCNGDGGDQMGCSDCPCGNNAAPGTIGGCTNSAGSSTRLSGTGDTSVSLPSGSTTDLRFTLSGAPPFSFGVLLSGNGVAPQNMASPCFGTSSGALSVDRDGLRCVVAAGMPPVTRHGGRSANATGDVMDSTGPSRVWGGEAQPVDGFAAQTGFVAGQTRFFQVTHREDAMAVCMRGLNTSQAVSVVFTP